MLFARFQGPIRLIIFLSLFVTVTVYADDEVHLTESQKSCLDDDDLVQDELKEQYFECEADDDDGEGPVADDCIAIDREPFISFLDRPQSAIASSIKSLAITLDEFFTNEKTYYDSSGSYLRLTLDTIFREGGRIDSLDDLDFKLRLPNTEKKLLFVFETESDQFDEDIKQSTKSTPALATTDEKKYVAEVQAVITENKHWRLKPIVGIKTGAIIDPFFRLHMDWNNNIGLWDLHWNETPHWFDSTGWGVDSLFEINRKFTDKILFRSSSYALWESTVDYFKLSEVISVFHTLSDKSAILYQAGVYGTSEPKISTTSYLLSIRYRQNIYKDYLFLELVPQVLYQKTTNFAPEHSLLFKLEILFKG